MEAILMAPLRMPSLAASPVSPAPAAAPQPVLPGGATPEELAELDRELAEDGE